MNVSIGPLTIVARRGRWPYGLWLDFGPHEFQWTRREFWYCIWHRDHWHERRSGSTFGRTADSVCVMPVRLL